MTTYIILTSLLYLTIFMILTWGIYKIQKLDNKLESTALKPSEKKGLDWKVYASLIIAFLLILCSCIAPFIFTRVAASDDFNFKETGQIGDTIGGLMNPFIALAGVIVTGLAFYIQYKANQQQRELFEKEQIDNKAGLQKQIDSQNENIKLQQFESQFYEMLKLHRENVTEMKIDGYDFNEKGAGNFEKFDRITEGRKIFVTMQTELEVILQIYKDVHDKMDQAGFTKCYFLFFSGIDFFEKRNRGDVDFIKRIRLARKMHMSPDEFDFIHLNSERKKYNETISLNFNYKPFSGHASRLGHYFRHLFFMVKSVANSDIVLDYGARMKYLKLLRAQLSNHEQILLFYNWLSGYGERWQNKENQFFTEYCMIHNLWHDQLFPDDFIQQNVDMLRKVEHSLRTGTMFEIDG